MKSRTCARRRAPRLTAAAVGLVFATGLSACSNAGLKHLSEESSKAHAARQAYASAGPVRRTDRGCLVPAARALLERLETRFGPVRVVSTCRRGATIAGTRRPSLHRYGKAIDLIAPPGRKAAVVRWLKEHSPGVTMTYHGLDHIHTDVGIYRRVILGARSRSIARRQSRASAPAAALQ